MRVLALVLLVVLAGGCKRAGGTVDPTDPTAAPACPEGAPHLTVGATPTSSSEDAALLRFDRNLRPCRGLALSTLGLEGTSQLDAVVGLPDGSEVVAVSGYSAARLVRVSGSSRVWAVERPDGREIVLGLSAVTFRGELAIAVVWGEDHGSGTSASSMMFVRAADGAELGAYEAQYETTFAGPAPSGQPGRVGALMLWDGIQEYRDDGGESLGTTGEMQIASPRPAGQLRSFVSRGGRTIAGGRSGVLSWSVGLPAAFLGPARCVWPATQTSPLPAEEGVEYRAVEQDLDRDAGALALVEGPLAMDDGTDTHLFRISMRGECERVVSIGDTHRARYMSWAGVP